MITQISMKIIAVEDLVLSNSCDYCDFSVVYKFPGDEEILESNEFCYVPREECYPVSLDSTHKIVCSQKRSMQELFEGLKGIKNVNGEYSEIFETNIDPEKQRVTQNQEILKKFYPKDHKMPWYDRQGLRVYLKKALPEYDELIAFAVIPVEDLVKSNLKTQKYFLFPVGGQNRHITKDTGGSLMLKIDCAKEVEKLTEKDIYLKKEFLEDSQVFEKDLSFERGLLPSGEFSLFVESMSKISGVFGSIESLLRRLFRDDQEELRSLDPGVCKVILHVTSDDAQPENDVGYQEKNDQTKNRLKTDPAEVEEIKSFYDEESDHFEDMIDQLSEHMGQNSQKSKKSSQ